MERLRHWARALKRDVLTLWIAARDPRTPWRAKLVASAVAAYALSPIDLIPDFIPIIGYLDDLVIVPLGIALAIRMIPAGLLDEYRRMAALHDRRPRSIGTAVLIGAIWLAAAALVAWWALGFLTRASA
ncbi:hypothetical protein GCM10007874_30270 [Labrys miyagiensis]|uniref:DUF1232 domain-containing protein n=1 Tax=Labrys miyagiensis TaxID=346912 RepID=A0ABQ6CJE2_9HYPH|nr:YkvA family protein [Labrys miyagiensis]GLS20010.1 hypothetical protein GCM10007874_30270 [Labrys miyagiensis]